MTVDLVNRDPNDINCHIKAEFEDVLGEPEGVRSMECVWKLSYRCFSLWRDCCYKLATLLCGICMAAWLGCQFAGVALDHIWCVTPGLKMCEINCIVFRKCYNMCIDCCAGPICEAAGLCLSKIKITKA
ncbi:caveolin-3-like isoform X2 [Ruditapes philippinarum]|uniref:caveolin-3-like isoform X2 n=1 Tax=Ruditapes philippinarum TaxID=129788 RepID=UPI00295B7595|nr:caveolin-3-like isoform X2 [Ruditapes philippinarum]